ncbi:MAG: class I SAM-dependent methyltransferase [Armatimonadetes bacterium]|nr:class I SAM-dependent methyltransferase [Armatimonadota bacterium]
MNTSFEPICAASAPCKCCGADAPLYGVADFHKHCNVTAPGTLALSGIPIYYHRCRECGFLFTAAFDNWTPDDFSRHVYNDEYVLADPDFQAARPANNAHLICHLFGGTPSLSILDYGGGNGRTAALLREAGFRDVDTYDPFVPAHAAKPARRYDLVISIEVLEHSPQPRATLEEMDSLVAPDGLILFSTLLQGADLETCGMNWWYIGPRNGHVSLHSRQSLLCLAGPLGYQFGSCGDGLHVLFRQPPEFARHFITGGKA